MGLIWNYAAVEGNGSLFQIKERWTTSSNEGLMWKNTGPVNENRVISTRQHSLFERIKVWFETVNPKTG